MSAFKRVLWVLGCITLTSQAWGQVAKSPFSQYGIGDLYSNALANAQGSGIGVSQPQVWFVNNQNPALLVYNQYSTFQAGIMGETRTIRASNASEKSKGGNMNYLVMAFPIKHQKWGTSVGLMPYSAMNYSTRTLENIEGSTNQVTVIHQGEGGLSQLYWSNGIRVYKDLSLGLKATYLFGSVNRISKFNQIPIATVEDKTQVKDFTFNAGVSYSKDSIGTANHRISIGAVYGFATEARTFLYNKNASVGAVGDTLTKDESRESGYTSLPSSITAGISFSKGYQWTIGTEFSYQDWSTFKTMDAGLGTLGESWSASLGGEFTPDPNAVDGFVKRITYRLGVSTSQYPFYPSGNAVKDLGINFGFSIPTGRSSIDLGFKIGSRGDKNRNVIEENYFKIYLGFTFNDIWFIKRKFD